jgi:hypothetical protein
MLTYISWIFVIIFTSCGMTSLPIELLISFYYKPKKLTKELYLKKREEIMMKSKNLLEYGII